MGTLRERLEAKLAPPDENGCRIFTGALQSEGYGNIVDENGRNLLAHRVSLALTGVVVEGKIVRHSCDNPPCCEPSHLKAGTQAQNLAEMSARGRSARGVRNARAKVTEEVVSEIRARRSRGEKQSAIARDTGLSQAAVSLIVSGKRWAHSQAA